MGGLTGAGGPGLSEGQLWGNGGISFGKAVALSGWMDDYAAQHPGATEDEINQAALAAQKNAAAYCNQIPGSEVKENMTLPGEPPDTGQQRWNSAQIQVAACFEDVLGRTAPNP